MSIVSAINVQDEKVSFGEWLKELFGKITGQPIGEYLPPKEIPIEIPITCIDGDGDGYNSTSICGSLDCNDANFFINPGKVEICGNFIDENCDGAIVANCGITFPVLNCTNGGILPNFTISSRTCLPGDIFEINWTDVNFCASNYTKTSSCDYNKNNLVCESFPGIDSVGIGGSLLNASKNYTNLGMNLVQLVQPGDAGVDFNWNFSNSLNFCDIKVEVADSSVDNFGYTIVKNISVNNKTIWVERLNNSNKVCVKDIPGEISINDFSNKCNTNNEVLVSCPSGINSTYKCEIVSDTPPSNLSWFKVWPLNHSAVKEMTTTNLITAELVCQENWNCTEWSNFANQCGARNCTDSKNCGTNLTKPSQSQTCVSQDECIPNWTCTEPGKCIDGFEERVCTDLNNCGDDLGKPSETQECEKGISPLIIALAIAGLILIIFLIWYFARKKDEEESSNETPAPHHSPPRSPPHPPANVYTPRPQSSSQLAPQR